MAISISHASPRTSHPLADALMGPNLLAVDAPLVALGWHWLVSREFAAVSPRADSLALFGTVWLIYMADRLLDSRHMDFSRPVSRRHRFVHRWSAVLWLIWGAVFLATGTLAVTALERTTLVAGCGLLSLVLVYAWAVHYHTARRRRVPKELIVGTLFAIGTCLPAASHGASLPLVVTLVLLAAMFTVNCLCVSMAQREADRSQGVASTVLMFPPIGDRLPILAAGVLAGTAATGWLLALPMPLALSLGISGVGLLALAWFIERRGLRTEGRIYGYLADYVLLSPVVVLVFLG